MLAQHKVKLSVLQSTLTVFCEAQTPDRLSYGNDVFHFPSLIHSSFVVWPFLLSTTYCNVLGKAYGRSGLRWTWLGVRFSHREWEWWVAQFRCCWVICLFVWNVNRWQSTGCFLSMLALASFLLLPLATVCTTCVYNVCCNIQSKKICIEHYLTDVLLRCCGTTFELAVSMICR